MPLHDHMLANGWPPTFPLDPTLSAPRFPDVSWLSLDDPPWVPGSNSEILQKERALRRSRSKRPYPGNPALPGSHAPVKQLAGSHSMGSDASDQSPAVQEGAQAHRGSQHAGTPGQQQNSIPSAANDSLGLPAQQHPTAGDQEHMGSGPTETPGSAELGLGHDPEDSGSSSTETSGSEELGSGQQLPRPPLSRLLATPHNSPAQQRKEALQQQDAAWRQQNLNLAGKAGSAFAGAANVDNSGEASREGVNEAGAAATGM